MSKSNFKISLFVICIFMFGAIMLCSCNSKIEYRASEDNVKQIGRTYMSDSNVLWCGCSGSGVEFNVNAKHCSIDLVGDNILPEPNHKNARLAIYVDNELHEDIMMNDDGKDSKTVEIDLKNSNSVIKILKLSEGQDSSFGIRKITADGEIRPTAKKDLKIEFVGDSIICGYGIDCKTPEDEYSTSIENFTKSFAYKTAQGLNADYSAICVSGIGVLSGYTETGKIADKVIKNSYTNYGVSDSRYDGDKNPQELEWDFNKFQPDIVVLNFGTNDSSYIQEDKSKEQQFVNAYVDLIKLIRQKNNDAYIVCTYGTTEVILLDAIQQAVSNASLSDDKVGFCKFNFHDIAKDGESLADHPSEITSQKDANSLMDYIKSNCLNRED